jgi:hypothetical protein
MSRAASSPPQPPCRTWRGRSRPTRPGGRRSGSTWRCRAPATPGACRWPRLREAGPRRASGRGAESQGETAQRPGVIRPERGQQRRAREPAVGGGGGQPDRRAQPQDAERRIGGTGLRRRDLLSGPGTGGAVLRQGQNGGDPGQPTQPIGRDHVPHGAVVAGLGDELGHQVPSVSRRRMTWRPAFCAAEYSASRRYASMKCADDHSRIVRFLATVPNRQISAERKAFHCPGCMTHHRPTVQSLS